MQLSRAEINELARIGVGLQYQTQMYNITAVDIASSLLEVLSHDNGSYVLGLVGNITGNDTIEFTTSTLQKFEWLPNDRAHGTAAAWLLMAVLSGVVMTLRFYARWKYTTGLRKDDLVLFLAWLVASVNNIEDIVVVIRHNWEAHCWNMTLADINFHYRVAAFDFFESNLSTFFFKSAFLIFYYDLYPSYWFRFGTIVMAVVVAIYTALCMIFYGLRCVPFDTWNHPYTYHCISSDLQIWYAVTAINIPIDLIIICMPIIPVRNLRLPRSEKLAVIALMGVGGFVCVASMVRLSLMQDYVQSEDVSRRALKATTWQLIEPHLGIVCVCIPALRKFGQSFFNYSSGRSSNHWQNASNHDTFINRVVLSRLRRSQPQKDCLGFTVTAKTNNRTVKSPFGREGRLTELSIDVSKGSRLDMEKIGGIHFEEDAVGSRSHSIPRGGFASNDTKPTSTEHCSEETCKDEIV